MKQFSQRLIGLIGRQHLHADEAYWFPYCRAIHTFGMQQPLDLIAVDKGMQIVAVERFVLPNRSCRFRGAYGVIETLAGCYWPLEHWIGRVLTIEQGGSDESNSCRIDLCER
ncbi:DUF192 domain-containing protein [Idiomarina tyrosinivorans]|nr:DUF192 domain-containing protein [Idiomarina tyrosinivorans]